MLQRLQLRGLILPDDVPAHESDPSVWTRAEGVNFRGGVTRRVSGFRDIYGSLSITPLHVMNSFFDNTNYWIYAGESAIYAQDDSGVETNLTPTSAPSEGDSNKWTSCELNGIPVMCFDDNQGPVWWTRDTADNFEPVPDWPSGYRARIIRAFKYHLIAMDIYNGSQQIPTMVMWSDAAEPGLIPDDGSGTTWDPTAANEAGFFTVGGATEGILDGLALRDVFMIYKNHAMFQMYWVGGQAVYGQRQFSNTAGVLARNCVASYRGAHLVLADNDVIVTDGNQIRSVVDGRARRHLFANLDTDFFESSFVVTHNVQNETWVCYPENGQRWPNMAMVYDWEQDAVSFRPLGVQGTCRHAASGNASESTSPDTYATTSLTYDTVAFETYETWDQSSAAHNLIGVDDGLLAFRLLDDGITTEEGSVSVVLRRESLDFGDRDTVKFCREVFPRVIGTAGEVINIRAGSQMEPDEPIAWGPSVPYTLGESRKADVRVRGRFLSFEITTTADMVLEVTGMDVRLTGAGGQNG